MYKIHADFVYYIDQGGVINAHMPFSTEEEAIEYVYENAIDKEGEWEIVKWPVD
jgi:cytochrome oxidase Cu insertion factor (SCO1/SenC/PrrC family)